MVCRLDVIGRRACFDDTQSSEGVTSAFRRLNQAQQVCGVGARRKRHPGPLCPPSNDMAEEEPSEVERMRRAGENRPGKQPARHKPS